MKKITFFKTLLVAAGLLGGVNVWADVTYDFEGDTPTNPFTNADGNRMTMNVIEDATLSSHVVKFDRNRSGYVAFAYYDFSSALVENASTVTIEFDYYVKSASGHDVISISDRDLHTLSDGGWSSGSNTGYGNNGVIFNLGCFRANNNNKFGINGAQNDLSGLGVWSHARIVVNNSTRTVDYTLTQGETELAKATGVSFLNASVVKCSQIDVYIGNANTGADVMIDNLSIASEADASVHTYTINAVYNGNTIKQLGAGMCTEEETFSLVLSQVIKDDSGNYYTLDANQDNITNYTASYTMGTADVVKEISYTLDTTIEYFSEAESFYGNQHNNGDTYSGGQAVSYMSKTTNATSVLSGGTYQMEVYVTGRFGSNPLNVYDATGTYQLATTGKGNSQFTGIATTGQFKAAASATVKVGLTSGNSLSFDYFIIRKVSSDATVSSTVTSAGYATFSSIYPLNLDEISGGTAYVVTSATDGYIHLEEATGVVPANTGLILKAENGGTVTIPVPASAGTAPTTNYLVAVTEDDTEVTEGNYVLAAEDDVAGFYLIGETTATLNAGKAYLSSDIPVSGGAKARLLFADDATAIKTIAVDAAENDAIYNVAGQRVNAAYKGIVIKNGKKYLNK